MVLNQIMMQEWLRNYLAMSGARWCFAYSGMTGRHKRQQFGAQASGMNRSTKTHWRR